MENSVESKKKYGSVQEFYPYYLTQHLNPISRYLHVFGTISAVIITLMIISRGKFHLLPLGIIIGYGFAWIGHFVFEKNKPATFGYFRYSFCCDFLMAKDFFLGTLGQKIEQAKSEGMKK